MQTASGEGDLSPLVVGSSANHTCSSSSPPGSPREVNASQDGSSSSGLAVPHDPVVRLVLSNGGRATVRVYACAHFKHAALLSKSNSTTLYVALIELSPICLLSVLLAVSFLCDTEDLPR